MSKFDQRQTPYADALRAHRERGPQRFMIPGHAGNDHGGGGRLAELIGEQAIELDIPQLIEGIDLGEGNAYSHARELAADAWGARTTWYLTNGASQGNRMALVALRTLGERILVQRSAHSSVYDGLVMAGLTPVYVRPSIDPIHQVSHVVRAEQIDEALAAAVAAGEPISSVAVVSPSYFGVVADVAAISAVCRKHGAALLVDGSWGAHFGFHEDLPESPTRLGADLAVSSIHKLGGSLTQTAAFHLVDGPFAERLAAPLDDAYRLTESTSLNSLLLASLDIARSELASDSERIAEAIAASNELRALISAHDTLALLDDEFGNTDGVVGLDPLHVAIDVRRTGRTGTEMQHALAAGDAATFVEISTPTAVVAIIGAHSRPDVAGLVRALERESLSGDAGHGDALAALPQPPAPGLQALSPRDAYFAEREAVVADAAVGRIAARMLSAYPPGIPNVVPGEVITQEAVDFLRAVTELPSGYIRGVDGDGLAKLWVCVD